jgi:hypothetical protein
MTPQGLLKKTLKTNGRENRRINLLQVGIKSNIYTHSYISSSLCSNLIKKICKPSLKHLILQRTYLKKTLVVSKRCTLCTHDTCPKFYFMLPVKDVLYWAVKSFRYSLQQTPPPPTSHSLPRAWVVSSKNVVKPCLFLDIFEISHPAKKLFLKVT